MAQKIYWNWKDDDLTFSLLNWLSGVLPSGVYRGYMPHVVSGYAIELRHTSGDNGAVIVDKDSNLQNNVGILMTPQGAVVKDDSPVALNVNPAHATLNRRDIIIASHAYSEGIIGGSPALYSIIHGTPAVDPALPAVPNPATDIVLATTYLKGGTSSMADPNNLIIPTPYPKLGNQPLMEVLAGEFGDTTYGFNAQDRRDSVELEAFYTDFDLAGFVSTVTGSGLDWPDPDKLYILKAGNGRKTLTADVDPQVYMPKEGWGLYKGRIYKVPSYCTTVIIAGPARKLVFDPAGDYRTGITAVLAGDTVTAPKVVIPTADVRMMNRQNSFNDWSDLTPVAGVTVTDTIRAKRVGQVLHFTGRASMSTTSIVDPDPNIGAFTSTSPYDWMKSDIGLIGAQHVKLSGMGVDLPYGVGVLSNLFYNTVTGQLYITDEGQGATTAVDLRGKYVILPDMFTF